MNSPSPDEERQDKRSAPSKAETKLDGKRVQEPSPREVVGQRKRRPNAMAWGTKEEPEGINHLNPDGEQGKAPAMSWGAQPERHKAIVLPSRSMKHYPPGCNFDNIARAKYTKGGRQW